MDATTTPTREALGQGLILLFAVACGAMVANLYYAQTLVDTIGPAIGLGGGTAGLITTLTQLGYALGLALLVPLGDLIENKRLVLLSIFGGVAASLGIALSQGPVSFLIASLLVGVCATGAQILIPLASHLTPRERQGRVIGLVMSGLLAGIMLARPVASFGEHVIGWRMVFIGSALLMAAIGLALAWLCPSRRPEGKMRYGKVLVSVFDQLVTHRALRMRAFYQAMLFLVFNLFWTAAPLTLIHRFGFDQDQVALFALAAAGGALAAPIAGAFADRGFTRRLTLLALVLVAISFLAADFTVAAGAVIAFAVTAITLDAGVQINHITGQNIVFSLSTDARARANAAYMTAMFLLGAGGSVIGSATYAAGGWHVSAITGTVIVGATLLVYLLFDRGASDPPATTSN